MDGVPVNLGVMDFAFMGGSMGSVVGEKIARLGQRSLEKKFPLILVSASGGARMQEGILSLMQMPRATVAIQMLQRQGAGGLHRSAHVAATGEFRRVSQLGPIGHRRICACLTYGFTPGDASGWMLLMGTNLSRTIH